MSYFIYEIKHHDTFMACCRSAATTIDGSICKTQVWSTLFPLLIKYILYNIFKSKINRYLTNRKWAILSLKFSLRIFSNYFICLFSHLLIVSILFEKLVTMRPEQGFRQLKLSIITLLTHFIFSKEQNGSWKKIMKPLICYESLFRVALGNFFIAMIMNWQMTLYNNKTSFEILIVIGKHPHFSIKASRYSLVVQL